MVDDGTVDVAEKPSVAGSWSVAVDGLKFEPQFPLVPGVKYRAFCDLDSIPRTKTQGDAFSLSVFIPKPPPGPRVRVLNVYPSANRLPENTLRLYIHFSGLVARGDVYKRVKLVRDDGKEVVRPLRRDRRGTVVGRRTSPHAPLRSGAREARAHPGEEHGPILEEGRSYTLTIDPKWPYAGGPPARRRLQEDVLRDRPRRRPGVAGPVETDCAAGRVGRAALGPTGEAARPGAVGPDAVGGGCAGQRVEGTLSVGGGERVVSFAPAKPWAKGA